ncbi:uncharacterized protein K444DRAFT_567251 [Hyaloscypha bicolor E]|uniref:C3H1-type domain-containing protein n=1 Tax=Hyaloscypha bicolor E TaxID=1095630 RepID=A0A2J6T0I3_9HELO|nr:uncharacterized protein K444DRAFT_567251 [Hyaloscypha bicolor E]PMD56548.1 hypothetical protein K444DRAFT_567251 [Hyaloscypha bicolor E]
MDTDDQDVLLAKISQLAGNHAPGQINRHKNGQNTDQQSRSHPYARNNKYGGYQQPSTSWRPNRGGYPSRGYPRGGQTPQVHRNRTLVLNGNTPAAGTDASASNETERPSASDSNAGAAWVTKQDRHLQLINTSIFEKDSQKRAKAIEQTRQQKLKQRDEREKARIVQHLQRGNYNGPSTRATGTTANNELDVNGIRFRVVQGGSKLVKVPGEEGTQNASDTVGLGGSIMSLQYPGDLNAAKSTPKSALVGGVRFYRSKSGNMYRSGIIKAYRRTGVVKKINEPCKIFTTTGSCPKGPRCRYIHDPTRVAVCKDFLQKGSCPSGDSCDLSHELTPERTPTCLHFAKGNCSNSNCRYTHIRVSPTASVCRPFGIYGYCEKGASCTERHVYECPDFSNTGTCTTKGCKLPHRHKASVMRNITARNGESSPEEGSDISSDDEDEEIGSDDVDSDDLDEEYFGDEDGKIDSDIPMQQDYVHLR